MFRLILLASIVAVPLTAQLAVHAETLHTMAGEPIANAVVLIGDDGTITAVGPASEVSVPSGVQTLEAAVVTPGLIDGRSTIGLSGYLNQNHDQDQLERSAPIQPELRAIDAYNPHEPLIEWARSFGVTTLHTGHAPGAIISGQTMIVKTRGNTIEEALVSPLAMIAATLSDSARGRNNKSPGTRAKMAAMLRESLLEARHYAAKAAEAEPGKEPKRDLRLEALGKVLSGEIPLLVTAHRSHDILTALRIAEEFQIQLVLDGAAEAYEVLDQIRASGFPVLLHPTMARSGGEREYLSMETAQHVRNAGVLFALQSGFEPYVPKSRLVLFEASIAAANGLSFQQALATVTIDAARILGIDDRVGSIEVGKDGDLALYDGDPFEYTTHAVGAVIEGDIVSRETR